MSVCDPWALGICYNTNTFSKSKKFYMIMSTSIAFYSILSDSFPWFWLLLLCSSFLLESVHVIIMEWFFFPILRTFWNILFYGKNHGIFYEILDESDDPRLVLYRIMYEMSIHIVHVIDINFNNIYVHVVQSRWLDPGPI